MLALLNGGDLRKRYAHLEDPPEGLFCEQIAAPGGAYLVGTGMSGQSTFALRTLVRCLFHAPPEDELAARFDQLFISALSVSDSVLWRAGLRRGAVWAGKRGGSVTSRPDLGMLVDAVRIPVRAEAMPRTADVLSPLALDLARVNGQDESKLVATPFLFDDDGLTVVFPFEIASALRHHVAKSVIDTGLEELFHLRCCFAIGGVVTDALTRMRMTPLIAEDVELPWTESELPMVESVYRFDTDKLAHVVMLVDDLAGYDKEHVFQTWSLIEHEGALSSRVAQVAEHLKKRADTSSVFSLVVFAPLDRGAELNFRHENSLALCIAARDLEALSFSEYGDQLGLWKFAKSKAELVSRARVHAYSPLDLYVPYRESERSFRDSRVRRDHRCQAWGRRRSCPRGIAPLRRSPGPPSRGFRCRGEPLAAPRAGGADL